MRVPGRGWVARHFRRLATMSATKFAIRTGAESLVAAMLIAAALIPLIAHPDDAPDVAPGFVEAVVVAPLLETLLFQTIPVRIAQFFTRSFRMLLVVAWLPFGLLHFMNGTGSGISAGLVGGFYVGFSYAVWARRSHLKAFAVTSAMHAFGNLVAWAGLSML